MQTVTYGAARKNFSANDARLIGLLVLLTFVLRLAALRLHPIPPVIIHDEFANLLGAQTFALGRLTNPAPPFIDSFREIHVLSEPTRMMRYQPGTALFLALGILLTGQAYWGVVLCVSLMVGASY